MPITRPKGRPKKFSEYEHILASNPPKSMDKRPVYVNNIGIFRGKMGDTAYIKLFLRHGNSYNGKSYPAGQSLEIPMGKLGSWDWARLEAERNQLQGRADRGEPLADKEDMLFSKYAETWLERAKVRQKSYQTSQYTLTRSLLPSFGKKGLQTISIRDVNDWQTKRLGEVKPATVQREKNILKAILNSAFRETYITSNPCTFTDKIRGIEERLRLWTAEELQTVVTTAGQIDEAFQSYVLWALYSAMRRGEILRMKWSDIKRFPNGETKIHLPTSKSDKPRQIPCNTQMLEILTNQRKRVSLAETRIFPISPKTIQRRMDQVRDKSGVKDINLHDLRTLNITYALVAGVDPKTLTGITGHKDLQMIQKHYSIVVDKVLSEATQKSGNYIDDLLREAEEKAKGKDNTNVIMIAAE